MYSFLYTIYLYNRYETGLLVGKDIGGKIPEDDPYYYMYSLQN